MNRSPHQPISIKQLLTDNTLSSWPTPPLVGPRWTILLVRAMAPQPPLLHHQLLDLKNWAPELWFLQCRAINLFRQAKRVEEEGRLLLLHLLQLLHLLLHLLLLLLLLSTNTHYYYNYINYYYYSGLPLDFPPTHATLSQLILHESILLSSHASHLWDQNYFFVYCHQILLLLSFERKEQKLFLPDYS